MEKQQIHLAILLCTIIFFGVIAMSLCIAAEFNKSKSGDLRMDGILCYLPGSIAFQLGTTALVSLFIAQIIGNFVVCNEFRLSGKDDQIGSSSSSISRRRPVPVFPIVLQILSWLSFVLAAILIGVGSSMNKNQEMGEGWLDGECYLVKDGIFSGSAALVFVTMSVIITSALLLTRIRKQTELGKSARPILAP